MVPRGVVTGWLLTAAVFGLGDATGASAQATATLEAGVSRVDYDGFLPSGAAAITPSLRLERAWASLTARGTALQFQSGNKSMQGAVAASVYAPINRDWRAEVAGTLGGSRYEEFARFWHALARGRLHRIGHRRGAWLGGSAGRTSYGAGSRAVLSGEGGIWAQLDDIALTAAVSATQVGDTTWADTEAFARWRSGRLLLDGNVGLRTFSQGAGSGLYAELTGTYSLNQWLALVVGGGRYPTDPIRGSISGRYATVGVRVRLTGEADVPGERLARAAVDPVAASNGNVRAAFDLKPVRGMRNRYEIRIRAPQATKVELMGSFTDWEPVELTTDGDGNWSIHWSLPPGVHRVNVRLDGGEWITPARTTPMPDDYGGTVGIFVVQ